MLGINTAHNTDVMGAFFSTSSGTIYSKSEIDGRRIWSSIHMAAIPL
jgi:hypothetical protein